MGPDHPDVASSLNNLAAVHWQQGRYVEAQPLLRARADDSGTRIRSRSPRRGNRLNNLAGLYLYQGRYAEAQPLYERALAIREGAFGPDHPMSPPPSTTSRSSL